MLSFVINSLFTLLKYGVGVADAFPQEEDALACDLSVDSPTSGGRVQ